jgi:hypothetical protein
MSCEGSAAESKGLLMKTNCVMPNISKLLAALSLCGNIAGASVAPMASERFGIEEYVLGQLDRSAKHKGIVACDPDGYRHRIEIDDLIGREKTKLIKVEATRALFAIPKEKNGTWEIVKEWRVILKRDDFVQACYASHMKALEKVTNSKGPG